MTSEYSNHKKIDIVQNGMGNFLNNFHSNRNCSNEHSRSIVKNKGELEMEILKVSAKSNPNSVAGALAGVLRERGAAEIQAIGAGALNQAVKAVAIARGFVAPSGVDLICIPAFTDIQIDGEERTAIKLIVEPR